MQFSIWIIAFLFAILAIAILCYTLLVFKGFQHSNKDTRALDTLTSRDGGLEFVTVAIVLPAAFILRVNEWISADSAMTLISGVVGYILGHYSQRKSKSRASEILN